MKNISDVSRQLVAGNGDCPALKGDCPAFGGPYDTRRRWSQTARPGDRVQTVSAQTLTPAPSPPRATRAAARSRRSSIRGAILIDGTGAPPVGPVDIVVEQQSHPGVRSAGTPGLPLRANRPPQGADLEVDATGMYVMPGFVSLHEHAGGAPKNPDAEYPFKLWLAHGVTTVRGVPLTNHALTVSERERSNRNEIVAPRIVNYPASRNGMGQRPGRHARRGREWVRGAPQMASKGSSSARSGPTSWRRCWTEREKHNLGSTAHLQQTGVAQMNALDRRQARPSDGDPLLRSLRSAAQGLRRPALAASIRSMTTSRCGSGRWRGCGTRFIRRAARSGRRTCRSTASSNTVFDPTMTAYAAGRDLMRMRNADWHARYTLPSLMDFYTPSRTNHGSYLYDWTLDDEIAWRNFYQVWFRLLNDYKKMGGRVTVSADAAFIYNTYGFGNIHEMELLQEAGFHPLEVIQAATYNPAMTLAEAGGKPIDRGVVRAGLLADMVIVDQNPLKNLKVLYGTGAAAAERSDRQAERVGGIKYTIKDGIVYDAKKLLADVAAMADKQRQTRKTTTPPSTKTP